jgi:hypothetical protein
MLLSTSGGGTSGVPKLTVPSLSADIGGWSGFIDYHLSRRTNPVPSTSPLYINEDGTEVNVVQVHPYADSMAFHMQVAGEHLAQAYEFLDTTESSRSMECPATPSWNR